MLTTQDIDNTRLGKSIEYHLGDLANDREKNGKLDNLAFYVFGRSAHYSGTGEFQLSQKKITNNCYRYFAKRIRNRKQ